MSQKKKSGRTLANEVIGHEPYNMGEAFEIII